uniref:Uncharacterized protein n=1 Tax=uncultured marine thaumarchaeote KM3_193_A03 TaxID=1456081 RepID=A0A075GW31_9ARCH|nr:hypothetical protein [uncultured marine thaumarchaeote KM3_193_A03]
MEKHKPKTKTNDRAFIIIGFVVIGIIFVLYSNVDDFSITKDSVQAIERLAIGFYVILLMSFGTIGYGIYRYHQRKSMENTNGILTIIAKTTMNSRSRKIFVATFIAYGMFFSLTAGLIVYQPDMIFSHHYDAVVPSAHMNACCGEPGYMPTIIVYVTEHVGLQIIPINLVLVVVVSYLVGLNTALAIKAISMTKKSGGLTSVGATTGLFIACPTCVSTFFAIFIGSSSAVTFTVILTQLQTLFIGITIPILLLTPILIAKKMQKKDDGCTLDPKT